MRNILIFGAGKSSGVLIKYLLEQATLWDWKVTVVDTHKDLLWDKTLGHPKAETVVMNITDAEERKKQIAHADVVISMLPPSLHIHVASDCVDAGKPMLTASYVDDGIRSLAAQAEAKKILLLCEMGLDPGIDHMSALKLIKNIQEKGGEITSFRSHCGGLVAPESRDNPWHYKVSWNPRNIVLAGKSGAHYIENKEEKKLAYEELFTKNFKVDVPGEELMAFYPNRDSTKYRKLYNLPDVECFMRTTLRHPDFIKGWNELIKLGLTDEEPLMVTKGKTSVEFFRDCLESNGIHMKDFAKLESPQLEWLGLFDNTPLPVTEKWTPADYLQWNMERKLALKADDKDMVVMMHEVVYKVKGENKKTTSTLVVKGNDHIQSAMAKTVGLPLAIAAVLILKGELQLSGVHIPVIPEIYEPVLEGLDYSGISFLEETHNI